jgi:hypothetical protein
METEDIIRLLGAPMMGIVITYFLMTLHSAYRLKEVMNACLGAIADYRQACLDEKAKPSMQNLDATIRDAIKITKEEAELPSRGQLGVGPNAELRLKLMEFSKDLVLWLPSMSALTTNMRLSRMVGQEEPLHRVEILIKRMKKSARWQNFSPRVWPK